MVVINIKFHWSEYFGYYRHLHMRIYIYSDNVQTSTKRLSILKFCYQFPCMLLSVNIIWCKSELRIQLEVTQKLAFCSKFVSFLHWMDTTVWKRILLIFFPCGSGWTEGGECGLLYALLSLTFAHWEDAAMLHYINFQFICSSKIRPVKELCSVGCQIIRDSKKS